ncbi:MULTISPECIES: hypothetical protein [unclassified Thioalkalivibrio]|uniref:hypothetical protein n=1 Tax=unclassified Thioalkalivibrio TaxID=2621013 RepID=UPI001E333716|nr:MULTISPECIES: hypothetical protein [unclassified Thioalkalivibrio]
MPEPDMGVRVRPADFARMLGVSRQTVSRWVQEGKVLVDPSGRLDPVKATERVLQQSSPGRLRAALLKPVMDDMAGLRTQLQEATARADDAEVRAAEAAADVAMLEAAGDRFIANVADRLETLAALGDREAARTALDDLYMDALDAVCGLQAPGELAIGDSRQVEEKGGGVAAPGRMNNDDGGASQ